MNKNELRLLSYLMRYGLIASEYKAWLDHFGVKPRGKIFRQALFGLISQEQEQ